MYKNPFCADDAENNKDNRYMHFHITYNNPEYNVHYTGKVNFPDNTRVEAKEAYLLAVERLYDNNNPQPETFTLLLPQPASGRYRYDWFIGQLEVGEQDGTPHIHIHVCVCKKMNIGQFKDDYIAHTHFAGAHIERVKSQPKHIEYVTKKSTRVCLEPYFSANAEIHEKVYNENKNKTETGKRKHTTSGARTDLMHVKKKIDEVGYEGAWHDEECVDVLLKNYKGFQEYIRVTEKVINRPNNVVIVLYGKPRTGKSVIARKLAEHFFPEQDPFFKPIGQWWDRYIGQKVVIMDDFDGCGQAVREIKNALDKTSCIVAVKGGSAVLKQDITIITTNSLPQSWFGEKNNVRSIDIEAVIERCNFFEVTKGAVDIIGNAATGGSDAVLSARGQTQFNRIIDVIAQTRRGIVCPEFGQAGIDRITAYESGVAANGTTAIYPMNVIHGNEPDIPIIKEEIIDLT